MSCDVGSHEDAHNSHSNEDNLYNSLTNATFIILIELHLLLQGINNSASELATILEHEAMEFSTSVSLEQSEVPERACDEPPVTEPALEEECLPDSVDDVAAGSSSSSDSLAENLHALPLYVVF